jgi:hypothetical protein
MGDHVEDIGLLDVSDARVRQEWRDRGAYVRICTIVGDEKLEVAVILIESAEDGVSQESWP